MFTKRRAEDQKPIVRVPVVVEVVRIQLTLVVIPVEVRDVTITVGIREDRTNFYANNDPEHHLSISSEEISRLNFMRSL